MKPAGNTRSTGSMLSNAAYRVPGLVLIFVVAINVVNAASRYLFAWSPAGADELMVYLLIVVVMAGSAISLYRRRHISVSLLVHQVSARHQGWLYRLHDGLTLVVCAVVALGSWQFVTRVAELGVRSMSLGMPVWIPHAVVWLGLVAMALVALIALRGRTPAP